VKRKVLELLAVSTDLGSKNAIQSDTPGNRRTVLDAINELLERNQIGW
jgi:hypothetical protein